MGGVPVRRALAALAVPAIAFTLAGCSGCSDNPPGADGIGGGFARVTITYGGAPLRCIWFQKAYGSGRGAVSGLSCDWYRWRGDHPAQAPGNGSGDPGWRLP